MRLLNASSSVATGKNRNPEADGVVGSGSLADTFQ
jgi:hypothetical protein